MTNIIQFSLNGDFYYTTKNITVYDVIKYFNYNDSLLVLELNKLICNKKKWWGIFIKNNDKI